MQITPAYYGVQMELLQPLSPEMERQFQQVDWEHPENNTESLRVALQLIQEYVFRNSGVLPDFNLGSVMQRGNTLVIVDPAEVY
jgi:hypothetical protein